MKRVGPYKFSERHGCLAGAQAPAVEIIASAMAWRRYTASVADIGHSPRYDVIHGGTDPIVVVATVII